MLLLAVPPSKALSDVDQVSTVVNACGGLEHHLSAPVHGRNCSGGCARRHKVRGAQTREGKMVRSRMSASLKASTVENHHRGRRNDQ